MMIVSNNQVNSPQQKNALRRSPHSVFPPNGETSPPHSSACTGKLNGKSANPDYQQTTFYLPKELHRQLKIAATQLDRDMSSIVEEVLVLWIDSRY